MRPPRHHVIVGCGAAAASLVPGLPLGPGDSLTVIGDDAGQLGRGLAYGRADGAAPWHLLYLLNSPAGAVDPGFAEWAAARHGEITARMARHPGWLSFGAEALSARDMAALFLPREIFGDYLVERAGAALAAHAAAGVQVRRITGRVTDLDRDAGGFVLILAGGARVRATHVDVATGGPGPQRFGSDTGPGAFPTLYGNEDAICAALRAGDPLTCLGGNAAMLDLMRLACAVLGEEGLGEDGLRMQVIAGSGARPEPVIWTRPRGAAATPLLAGPFKTAEALLDAADAEIARLRAVGADMAALRPGFRRLLDGGGFARLLPDPDQRQRIGARLERRFRRGTHDSLVQFDRLARAGRITVKTGRITGVDVEAPGRVQVGLAGAETLTVPLVVNAAGPGNGLALDPVTTGLIRRGWLRRIGGGIALRGGLRAEVAGLRYLSPAIARVGDDVPPFPLYDYSDLRRMAEAANADARAADRTYMMGDMT